MTRITKINGFTLLEVMTALTIFLIIISVVYGSYITTTQSVDHCQAKIKQAQQARLVLTKMSQQLRCCYVTQSKDSILNPNNFPSKSPELNQAPQVIFESKTQNTDGVVLKFITSTTIYPTSEIPNELIAVTYKYDAEIRKLLVRQQIFAPTSQFLKPQSDWKILGEDIADIKLNFLSDDKWLDKWDYQDKQTLPEAVKITLLMSGSNKTPIEYRTVAPVIIEATK